LSLQSSLSLSSSLKWIVGTWIAALLGALAGRTLAEGSRPSHAGAAENQPAVESGLR
jgi:hypothetical protein